MVFAIEPLIQVLKEITELNKSLQSLGERKKDVLIAGDMKELSEIVQQENRFIKALGRLEEDRQLVVEQLAKDLHIDRDAITYSDILTKISNTEQRKELERTYLELKAVVNQISNINELNQQLIQQSLDIVNHSIELITDATDEQVYQKPSTKEGTGYPTQQRSFFDSKA